MNFDYLKSIAKDTVLLNIRIYSSLIDLQRNYLHSLEEIVKGKTSPTTETEPAPTPTTAARKQGAVVIPPIVLAASAGESAAELFEVVNHLDQAVAADVVISGDLPIDIIHTEPSGRMLDPGETGRFRVTCTIDETIEIGRDRHGVISVPGLASRSIPLIIRRLENKPLTTAAATETEEETLSDTKRGKQKKS